jgi:hypothetical protein
MDLKPYVFNAIFYLLIASSRKSPLTEVRELLSTACAAG